jgi:hypothetical protein
MKLSKLRGRSSAELRFRGAQAATAWLERVGVGDLRETSLARHLLPAAQRDDAAAWCAAFRRRRGTGFFAGFDDIAQTTRRASESDASGTEAVLRIATRALEDRFDLLGHRDLSFGTPIDWHLDPVFGRRSPRAHWSRIDYLDPAVAGDHKVVWELNRHHWLVSLAQAWRLTGDARFAAKVDASLVAWMDANPPKRGVNWASSLEVAFRAISWLWTLRLLGDAAPLRDATVMRAVGHLRLAARHLARNLSTYFSPNTHLTGEALALYYLGHELRDLGEAEGWRDTGRRVLLEWLPTHVRADGTYFEQSTWYHRYTLDFYVHFWLLGTRTGDALPATVPQAIGRLGDVLMHVTRGDGTMPLIGDDDGGRLLFLDGRTSHDTRPALAIAGLVSGRADLVAAGDATTDTLWLIGPDATERADSSGSVARAAASRLFPEGGVVVLRDGWETDASVLVMDAGPHGAMNCGHAHADALAFDLSWEGAPLLVDPGTKAYTTSATTRDAYRATASHNAATVDGKSSSVMTGPFSWGRKATTRVTHWRSGRTGDCVVASHDGFDDRGSRPFAYERLVLRAPTSSGSAWIVIDRFHAAREVALTAHFQVGPDVGVRQDGDGSVHLSRNGADVATLWTFGGAVSELPGEVSGTYGTSEPAPHLGLATHGNGVLSLGSVFVGPGPNAPAYHEDQGALSLVLCGDSTELVVLCGGGSPARWGDVSFDGVVFWGEREAGSGALLWWEALGARRVEVAGAVLLDSMNARDAGSSAGAASLNSN